MISMYTKQEIIISSYREGKSQRQISKELGINRKTVKKYLDEYGSLEAPLPGQPLNTSLLSSPIYQSGPRTKRVLTEEIKTVIDELLSKNAKNRSSGLHKQQMNKHDILEHLQDQGFKIGYTTVCNYIRGQSIRSKEAFIRQIHQPASSCEFDWGEVKLFIKGKRVSFHMAVFTSSFSNYRYARLYHRQDTLALMESHVAFFEHIGGVYHTMVYDNMRTAVKRMVSKGEKEPTEALSNLKGHYCFKHRFCNYYRGNEKGHVERSVEYVRRKSFSSSVHFDSLQEAQGHLLKSLERLNHYQQQHTGKSAKVLFEEEKPVLWSAPLPFSCYMTTELKVDKYATVSYSSNRYSVPDTLVGQRVEIKTFSDELKVYHKDQLIGVHQRSYGKHEWLVKLEHYLGTLKKKPGALAESQALTQSDGYVRHLFDKYFEHDPRSLIEVLLYCQKNGLNYKNIKEAESRLLAICPTSVTSDKLIALLGNKNEPTMKVTTNQDEQIVQGAHNQLKTLANLIA